MINVNKLRAYTNALFDAMEAGEISAQAIADMALCYMSEDDVRNMCLANDLFQDQEECGDCDDEG